MKLNNEEIRKLLNIAGYGLSLEIKRDFIISFCIERNLNIFETNDALLEFDEAPLVAIAN